MREQALLDGFAAEMARRHRDLPDDLFWWILDER